MDPKYPKYYEYPSGRTMLEHKKRILEEALDRAEGNRTQAAKDLQIAVRTLRMWLKRDAKGGKLHQVR